MLKEQINEGITMSHSFLYSTIGGAGLDEALKELLYITLCLSFLLPKGKQLC